MGTVTMDYMSRAIVERPGTGRVQAPVAPREIPTPHHKYRYSCRSATFSLFAPEYLTNLTFRHPLPFILQTAGECQNGCPCYVYNCTGTHCIVEAHTGGR